MEKSIREQLKKDKATREKLAATPPIENVQQAKDFIRACVAFHGLGFHNDTRFEDYVYRELGGVAVYMKHQAEVLNRRMDEAMLVLERDGEDPYGVGLEEMRKLMNAKA